jgi:beta-lactamase regulating signal transducer with metallopeptidase domain
MNAYLPLDSAQLWQLAGWTMVHFLWLGAAAAALALVCRFLLHNTAPNLRYAAALTCLLLLAVMPIAIAAWLVAQNSPHLKVEDSPWRRAIKGGTASAAEHVAPLSTMQPGTIELNAERLQAAPPNHIANEMSALTPLRTTTTKSSPTVSPKTTPISFAPLQHCVPYLPWLWLIGTPITFALLAMGVVGTKRLRIASHTINDDAIKNLSTRLASSLRITRRVGLAVCDRIATPVLIGILRPMILLPPAALTGWSPDEIEMVLLHELAHVRRWDNLVNLLQRCIESLLFFHPAVWIISTWVRREREDCCDAIVVRRTERPHAYAELLLNLATAHQPLAGLAFASHPLRSRIRRILEPKSDPMLISSKSFAIMLGSILVATTFIVLYVPTIGQAEESPKNSIESLSEKLAITDDPDKLAAAHLPYAVKFEPGVSRFKNGDNISILEVRGTSPTFEPGNVYQIKGKYTLGSNDRARLCAFTTAKKAADGTGPVWEIQATNVNRGEGTFTLFLPMKHKGWPHVSFYPAGKAAGDIGGIYFGTGDSVLKKWWKDGDAIDKTSSTEIPASDLKISNDDGSISVSVDGNDLQLTKHDESSPDDWLKEAHLTPEEFEVAERAWKELGVKFVTASDEELQHIRRGGAKGGLKALGLEDTLNVKAPVIFTHFQSRALSTGIPNFASLNKALDALTSGRPGETVVLQGFNKGGGIIQYSIQWPLKSDDANTPSHPKFPSLENQKLADQVWKKLGLETETIGDYDLKRVKALGYDGGLLISGRPGTVAKTGADQVGESILTGDILVGLYVWPTTSLADVAKILQRDDIAELSPLKFYVVRQSLQGPYADGPTTDNLITGRISVQRDRNADPQAQMEAMRKQANDPAKSIPPDLYYYSPNKAAKSGDDIDSPAFVLPSPDDEDTRPRKRQSRIPRPPRDGVVASATSSPGPDEPPSKSALRYDDKTFDQWRDLWKNELSTTKRTEAIKALAAFARAGYGKEATETILDVAGEYDFNLMSNDAEGKLKTAVLNELVPESGHDALAKFWLPDLAARLKQDSDQWTGLTWNLMSRFRTDDPSLIAIVESLVANKSPDVRSTALSALIRSTKSAKDGRVSFDDQTQKLMTDALKGGEPAMIYAVSEHLFRYPQYQAGEVVKPILIFQPELVPLLFHDDEFVQQRIRGLFHTIDAKDAPRVVEQLTAELQDQNPERRLAAIRALAAIGPKAKAALPSLKELVNSASDTGTLVATYVAIQKINHEDDSQTPQFGVREFTDGLNENEKKAVLERVGAPSPKFMKLTIEEANAIMPQNQNFGGGGGFGGGGYSGGGFF